MRGGHWESKEIPDLDMAQQPKSSFFGLSNFFRPPWNLGQHQENLTSDANIHSVGQHSYWLSSGPFKCRSTSPITETLTSRRPECRLFGTSLILSRILENWKLPQNTRLSTVSWLLGYFCHRIKCIQTRSQLRNSSRTCNMPCEPIALLNTTDL